CSYEEAREIFTVPEQLVRKTGHSERSIADYHSFAVGPCQNGATCVNQINTYICICPVNYEEILPPTSYGCLYRNGGCEHFCVEISDSTHRCDCAPGYTLHTDNSSCVPKGQSVNTDILAICSCPWQVRCSVVLCNFPFSLILSSAVAEHIRGKDEGTEQIRKVSKVFIHPWYNHSSTDSDIALLRLLSPIRLDPFAIPVCLPPANGTFGRTIGAIRMSTVSGWGRLAQSGLPSPVLQRLKVTRNMLCAGFIEGSRDSCQGDSGGPLTTRYKNIVSWGKGCAHADVYGIYTRVSVFVEWILKSVLLLRRN
uniref:Coagulation factor VII, like n=1 Tax=Sinocyclocheilus rhinocerous TaxID=307959 RepID=A0A673G5R4_9TELE